MKEILHIAQNIFSSILSPISPIPLTHLSARSAGFEPAVSIRLLHGRKEADSPQEKIQLGVAQGNVRIY